MGSFSQANIAFPTLTSMALEVLPGDEPAAWPLLPATPWGFQWVLVSKKKVLLLLAADWAWKELCSPLGSIPTAIWSSIFNCRSFTAGDDACAGMAPPHLLKLGLQGHVLENHLFSFKIDLPEKRGSKSAELQHSTMKEVLWMQWQG